MVNSADPDQLASSEKPTDLDLHCLQRQIYQGSAGQGLTLDLCFTLHTRNLIKYLIHSFDI